MGFFDALFGRVRPQPPKRDRLFALATAGPDIEERLGVRFAGRAAVVLRATEASHFLKLQQELADILKLGGPDLPVTAKQAEDTLGFRWVVLTADALTSVLAAIRLVENLAEDAGFPDALLAALFDFTRWALVWSYRRGAFYPFAQTGPAQRDRALEMRVGAVLSNILPIEQDLETWYPLWDPPW
jgi:hypothetical protein